MEDEDVTQWEERDDPEHMPPARVPAISVGWWRRSSVKNSPPPVSAILRPEMEQSPQPETVMVQRDSGIPGSRVSLNDSDSDLPVPGPDNSGIARQFQPMVSRSLRTLRHGRFRAFGSVITLSDNQSRNKIGPPKRIYTYV
jgi:hypothetical protein